MKKAWFGLLIAALVISPVIGFSFDEMEAEGISLKAGPTDFTEELPISWVETVLYPKMVEKGWEIFVEAKLTSQVKAVNLKLDYEKDVIPLYSDDGKNWSRLVKMTNDTPAGIHIAKVIIEGKNGKSIQRSLDFTVKADAQTAGALPLTVLSTAVVMENGRAVRQLLPGVQVTAVCKAPFYRVKLDDGSEGWIEAAKVKDPTEELFISGVRAYQQRNLILAERELKSALDFEPRHARAHLYLAKVYLKQGKTDAAIAELKDSLASDPNNETAQKMAQDLARQALAEKKYDQVIALKPEMVLSRLAAKPEKVVVVAKKPAQPKVVAKKAEPPVAVSNNILKETVELVKNQRTSKGTPVNSAIASVLSLTRSLGTRIKEEGWKVVSASDGIKVIFACNQERAGKSEAENFIFKVDPDRKVAVPINDNARLLMNRW